MPIILYLIWYRQHNMHGLWEEGIRLHCSERGGHVVSDGNNEYGVIIHYIQSSPTHANHTLPYMV